MGVTFNWGSAPHVIVDTVTAADGPIGADSVDDHGLSLDLDGGSAVIIEGSLYELADFVGRLRRSLDALTPAGGTA